jgi:hypothetical protein
MVQCDECGDSCLTDEARGWAETAIVDLCPQCADARALDAEHDLSVNGGPS